MLGRTGRHGPQGWFRESTPLRPFGTLERLSSTGFTTCGHTLIGGSSSRTRGTASLTAPGAQKGHQQHDATAATAVASRRAGSADSTRGGRKPQHGDRRYARAPPPTKALLAGEEGSGLVRLAVYRDLTGATDIPAISYEKLRRAQAGAEY